ncbi:hypothetical protein L9F63_017536, partial [Diploptera punctata]
SVYKVYHQHHIVCPPRYIIPKDISTKLLENARHFSLFKFAQIVLLWNIRLS